MPWSPGAPQYLIFRRKSCLLNILSLDHTCHMLIWEVDWGLYLHAFMEITEEYFTVDWYWGSFFVWSILITSILIINQLYAGKAQFAQRSPQTAASASSWTNTWNLDKYFLQFGQIQFAQRSRQVLNWSEQTAASAFPLKLAAHCNLAHRSTALNPPIALYFLIVHRTLHNAQLHIEDSTQMHSIRMHTSGRMHTTADWYQLHCGILCCPFALCTVVHCTAACIRLQKLCRLCSNWGHR